MISLTMYCRIYSMSHAHGILISSFHSTLFQYVSIMKYYHCLKVLSTLTNSTKKTRPAEPSLEDIKTTKKTPSQSQGKNR